MRFGLQLGAQCAGEYEDCADDLTDEELLAEEDEREKRSLRPDKKQHGTFSVISIKGSPHSENVL